MAAATTPEELANIAAEDLAYQKANIDDDRGPMVIGISAGLMAAACIAVTLRFVSRKVRLVKFGWDDWLLIPALIFTSMLCLININSTRYGLGKHFLAVKRGHGYQISKMVFFVSLDYAAAHWSIKMAILFTLKRLFPLNFIWFKCAVYGMMVFVNLWAIALLSAFLAACKPMDYFWQRFNTTLNPPAVGTCQPYLQELEQTMTLLNAIGDFVMLAIPLLVFFRLKVETGKIYVIIATGLVGGLACTASVKKYLTTADIISGTTDPTWDSVGAYLWTAVEAGVALTCCCVPSIASLCRGKKVPKQKEVEMGNSMQALQRAFSSESVEKSPNPGDTPVREREMVFPFEMRDR